MDRERSEGGEGIEVDPLPLHAGRVPPGVSDPCGEVVDVNDVLVGLEQGDGQGHEVEPVVPL